MIFVGVYCIPFASEIIIEDNTSLINSPCNSLPEENILTEQVWHGERISLTSQVRPLFHDLNQAHYKGEPSHPIKICTRSVNDISWFRSMLVCTGISYLSQKIILTTEHSKDPNAKISWKFGEGGSWAHSGRSHFRQHTFNTPFMKVSAYRSFGFELVIERDGEKQIFQSFVPVNYDAYCKIFENSK